MELGYLQHTWRHVPHVPREQHIQCQMSSEAQTPTSERSAIPAPDLCLFRTHLLSCTPPGPALVPPPPCQPIREPQQLPRPMREPPRLSPAPSTCSLGLGAGSAARMLQGFAPLCLLREARTGSARDRSPGAKRVRPGSQHRFLEAAPSSRAPSPRAGLSAVGEGAGWPQPCPNSP